MQLIEESDKNRINIKSDSKRGNTILREFKWMVYLVIVNVKIMMIIKIDINIR